MHKWLGFSLFPRSDFGTVRNDELKLLYAMIKRKKISPMKFMMNHWLEIPGLKGDVGCTSLVTRIAKNLGLLENAYVIYINVPHWLIDYDYFNHAHMWIIQPSSCYQIGTSVCMQWIRLSLICR